MIKDGENWYYLTMINLPKQLEGITSKNNGDYYCTNCLHLFRTTKKLSLHEYVCKNHDWCHIKMLKKKNLEV